MRDLVIKFYLADSAYMTALRLVSGAYLALHDIDVDASEDFKVCVTESAIILKNCGFEQAEITFCGGDAACTVKGKGGTPRESENDFSLALISALVKSCEIERKGGIIERVTLKI